LPYWILSQVRDFGDVFRRNYSIKKEKHEVSFTEIQEFMDSMSSKRIDVNPYDILLGLEGHTDEVKKRGAGYLHDVGLVNV
jgi:hypothetical protein